MWYTWVQKENNNKEIQNKYNLKNKSKANAKAMTSGEHQNC